MLDTNPCLPHPGLHYSSFLFARETGMQDSAVTAELSPEQAALEDSVLHTQQSLALLRQISTKAPQLAAVLDLLDEQHEPGAPRRIEFIEPVAPRADRTAVLDMTAGLLSNAFPLAAPLFHSCRAYLQLKLLKRTAA